HERNIKSDALKFSYDYLWNFQNNFNPFYNCLLEQVLDLGIRICVLYMYGLLATENEYVNCEFLHKRILLLGCYFYLKQAIHKKFKKLNISLHNSSIILTTIELLNQAEISARSKVSLFLGILQEYWLIYCDHGKWNFSEITNIDTTARTNNAWEHYNRR
ncbi:hypothetical protein HZS_3594, partial [Henneguya salminicola]